MNPPSLRGNDHTQRNNMTLTETYLALLKEFDIAQDGEMVYRFCDKGHNHSYKKEEMSDGNVFH